MQSQLTPETLAAVTGIILSLAFSYVPGANTWYAAKEPVVKRLIMAGLLLLVAIVIVLLSCTNVMVLIVCEKAGFLTVVQVFISALIANQAAFLISPAPEAVKQAQALKSGEGL